MGKALDNLPLFKCIWYEDEKGNNLSFDPMVDNVKYDAKFYQLSNFLEVRSSMHSGNTKREDNFVVRFLKWLLKKVPSSWHNDSVSFSGSSTINAAWPVVKYMVEQRNWNFHDACVLYSSCCERCSNILSWEAEGSSLDYNYLKTSNTWCYYCKYVDEEYHRKKFIKAIYNDYFFYNDKDISCTWKEYTKEPPKDEGI